MPLLMTDLQIKESKLILIIVNETKLKYWKTICYLYVLISCRSHSDKEADKFKPQCALDFLNVQHLFLVHLPLTYTFSSTRVQ